MFWTIQLVGLLSAGAVIVALVSLLYVASLHRKCWVLESRVIRWRNDAEKLNQYCRDAVDYVQNGNEKSVALAKVMALEAAVTDLTDAYDQVHTSLKKLRSRISMRNKRAADATNGTGEPDPRTDPAGYKAYMREKLGLK